MLGEAKPRPRRLGPYPERRPLPLAPRPFQTPASLLGCTLASAWGCQLRLRDVLPWRAASFGWRVAYETVHLARAGPEARALWVILGHPSFARVPGSEGRQDLGRSLRRSPLLRHQWVFFVLW